MKTTIPVRQDSASALAAAVPIDELGGLLAASRAAGQLGIGVRNYGRPGDVLQAMTIAPMPFA